MRDNYGEKGSGGGRGRERDIGGRVVERKGEEGTWREMDEKGGRGTEGSRGEGMKKEGGEGEGGIGGRGVTKRERSKGRGS